MTDIVRHLSEGYKGQPIIRALVQLVPGASALEAGILSMLEQIEKERLREMFDELSAGRRQLDEKTIQSEDFLHAFFATSNAVRRTRRREKIRYMARLLSASFSSADQTPIDEFEELLSVLEELSFRELRILSSLDAAEQLGTRTDDQNDLQFTTTIWTQFESSVKVDLDLTPEDLAPMLVRLQRTGCYSEFTGTFLGYEGGLGCTTPLFRRLTSLIQTSQRGTT